MRALVTGAAGFLGSHLVDLLLGQGWEVVGLDDLSTGHAGNLAPAEGHPAFSLVRADVSDGVPAEGRFDRVFHLASAASPDLFEPRALQVLRTASQGTWNVLSRAEVDGARVLLASTSEVYGEPTTHPQREDDPGAVDPVAPRSAYAEGKRYAEALVTAWARAGRADVRIARIFNTYGPRLRDGRVVTAFCTAALRDEPLPVFGDGGQTRSLCYVSDLVQGLVALMESDVRGPCNLGRDDEISVLDLARAVIATAGGGRVVHRPLPPGDPTRRCPDLTRARHELGWSADMPLDEGLRRTVAWLRSGD